MRVLTCFLVLGIETMEPAFDRDLFPLPVYSFV